MLYNSYDVEVIADRLEMEAEVIKEMNELHSFEFTYKTHSEYLSDKLNGYIDEYKNVRIEVITNEGWNIDFPAHSEEDYYECLNRAQTQGDRIIKVYANVDHYEPKEWY